jgi:hypothetical protein
MMKNTTIKSNVWRKKDSTPLRNGMIEQPNNYSGIERKTRTLLANLQKQGGRPIFTLSPKEARAVLSKDMHGDAISPPKCNLLTVNNLFPWWGK